MKYFLDLFSGVGGAALAARRLGYEILCGVDTNRDFGSIYVTNFQVPVNPQKVEDVNFRSIRHQVDWIHASPDITSASRVKLQREPSELSPASTERLTDVNQIRGIVRAAAVLVPRLITLESLEGFASFGSYNRLKNDLEGLGYALGSVTLTPTQVGIPQTRNRLFTIARRDGDVKLPTLPSKSEADQISWMSVLSDEREINEWEDETLYPSFVRDSAAVLRARTFGPTLFFGSGRYGSWFTAGSQKPSLTVVASQWKRKSAVILPDGRVKKVPFHIFCRLMDFPSTFLWTESRRLNLSGLGAALVPRTLETVVRPNLE